MPKATALRIISSLKELDPKIQARIVSEDVMLYRLGFVDDIPCRLEIPISPSDAEELYDKVIFMEIEAFNYTDDELRDEATKKEQQKYEKRYYKFAFLEPYLLKIMRCKGEEIDAGTVDF